MKLNSRAGELMVLAGLTLFFAGITLALALTGKDTGPAATALISTVGPLSGGILLLVRGDHPSVPAENPPGSLPKP